MGLKPLFVDCQTTGMHPSLGHLLELAWESELGAHSVLIRLPEGEKIPARVTEITGIRMLDMTDAVDLDHALSLLQADLEKLGSSAAVIAHYAQFEKAFLSAAWKEKRGSETIPWVFLCTYKIAKLLYPEAPSRNIRALVGYFEIGETGVRRASEHAAATRKIWDRLQTGLNSLGLSDADQILDYLSKTKAPKATKLEFRVDRLLRLSLPDCPGVYRMQAKSGKTLYVGKATSLKDRVNSYFRGKGPGARKREMLAQVYDIQITECGSALEAALLECEQIKRLDPPYNVSLKAGQRGLRFYTRDLCSVSNQQNEAFPLGPFSKHNAIEDLTAWRDGEIQGETAQIFFEEVPPEILSAGLKHFYSSYGIKELPSLRSLLALGLWIARAIDDTSEEAEEEEEEESDDEENPLTPEEVATQYEGLLIRAAREFLRSKRLTRLLRCRVHLKEENRWLEVNVTQSTKNTAPWEGLGIAEYDRMSVLLMETTRHGYPVESQMGSW
jgi:DNA polymerase-3 subunit epsilon